MPFQYSPYHNAYAGTIADLMAHGSDARAAAIQQGGTAQAQAVQSSGEATARAQELGGQAWGRAIGNIGQQVQSTIQQATDPRRQMEAAQVEDWKRNQAARPVLAAAIKQFTDPQTGKTDYEKVGSALSSAGLPDLANSWLKMAASNAEALDTLHGHATAKVKQTIATAGDLAFRATSLNDFVSGIGLLTAAGGIDDEKTAAAILQQADAAGPDGWKALQAKFLPLSPAYQKQQAELEKPVKVGDGEKVVIPSTGVVVAKGDEKPPTEIQVAGKAAAGDPTAQATMAIMKPGPPPKGFESKSVLLDGQPAEVSFDPASGKFMLPTGEDVSARVKPIPPASVQIYNQTLADGKGEISPVAQAMADYKTAPPSPRSVASGAGKALMEQVLRANPAYDATQFPTRQKMRIAFTSGPQSQTINSLNTAISHLDQFTNVVQALDNGNFQPGNAAYNWLKATFGNSAPTNFAGIRDIMSGELASAFKKSGATNEEIASVKSAIASKNSTGQLMDYVKTIALPALGSKVINFDQQYRQVMGEKDPFKILLPESEAILQKHGIDPAHPQMGGGGGLRDKAKAVLSSAGKASDAASIDTFLKNNPGFK